MRYLLIIILFTSCYTKKKAIEKFCQSDTTTIVVRDTIYTESVKHDTTFSERVDSIYIEKDRLRIIYKKKRLYYHNRRRVHSRYNLLH
jgi:hypothetical protein